MAPSASLAGALVGILIAAAVGSRWVIDALFGLAGG
jgi:hypothetical protein